MPNRSLVSALARALQAGEPTLDEVVDRAGRALGRRWRWLRPLAQRYLDSIAGRTRPRHREVVQFLRGDEGFQRAAAKYIDELAIEQWLAEPQTMQPVAAAATWDVPALDGVNALADWLGLDAGELDWFADLKRLGYRKNRTQLRHYHYRAMMKGSGGVRLIEAPKPRLKQLQRKILAGILDEIPAHAAVHGFVRGRSIQTFVAPHVGQRVVLRMDLQDFFPSIRAARVQTFFRTVGYPEAVANLLGAICTTVTPGDVVRDVLYSRAHLPQGAPTSPALANLCTYRVDCRLTGLAASAGARYTRYADDLAFSGGEEFERCVERFSWHAAAILLEEGCAVNHRKTRVMRQGVRQHLAGLVANERMNVRRSDFDLLKAILHNCVRLGPEQQNREGHPHFRSHLAGRVAFVETINPSKGKRLRALLEKIQW